MANVIFYIDTARKCINYFELDSKTEPKVDTIFYRTAVFSPTFYERLGKDIEEFDSRHHDAMASGVTIVLPDCAYASDIITVPVVKGANVRKYMQASVDTLFVDREKVKVIGCPLIQTKQYLTTGYFFVQNNLVTTLRALFAQYKIPVHKILPASLTLGNGAASFNSKLKSGANVFLDIKQDSARLLFLYKGRGLCTMPLPFGYSILKKDEVISEYELFNHNAAALEVANARRRAKTKMLLIEEEENDDEELEESSPEAEKKEPAPAENGQPAEETPTDETPAEEKAAAESADTAQTVSEPANPEDDEGMKSTELSLDELYGAKSEKEQQEEAAARAAAPARRKLPKYMLRPEPETAEGFMYENFRLFMKWTLGAIADNEKVISLAQPEAVYVNLPERFDFLYDMVNAEAEENKIKFLPSGIHAKNEGVSEFLEVYGATVRGKNIGEFGNF